MVEVYIVSKRLYRKAYYAEPYAEESIVKVFNDYHKAVEYICDAVKKDHNYLDNSGKDLTHWNKYDAHPCYFREGYYIKSIAYSDIHYRENTSYRFRTYAVE